ncbi:MAG: FIST N-terminal domain-containing protein [Phycisphaerales bacterium]|jgi:hypothetical protein|nr:FIST N-terminal domain-containing protein [Phycisphaerales bacterium]
MAGPAMASTFARTTCVDARDAVTDLHAQLGDAPGSALIFYASPRVDFPAFARALHGAMGTPSIGCTTAGEISSAEGHCEDGVVAVLVRSADFAFEPRLVEDASGFNVLRAQREIGPMIGGGAPPSFAITLIDGLSFAEEQVCASLANAMPHVPLVGGSAGDNLRFKSTWVAVNGQAAQNAVAMGMVRTALPFRVFQAHHFEPTFDRLVVTGAVPSERRVTEINGEVAAEGYARAVGLRADQLSPTVFAEHPVMLSIGGSYYVRSIQRVNDDGSLTFFCAIAEGLVLRVARGLDLPRSLERQLGDIASEIGELELVLGYDCILRRLEILSRGQRDEVGRILGKYPLIGFSTYGEQLNGLHMNQTLTGVALGRAA